jgi:outer membrane protein assembly factor BamB
MIGWTSGEMEKNIGFIHVFLVSLLLLSSSAQAFCSCSFCLDGDTPPQWKNQMQSASRIPNGGSIVLQADAMDVESLRQALLSTNETGTWRNLTECSFMWQQEAVYGYDNFGTATYENGVLYAPSKGDHVSDGKVYALNASNGNIIWNATVRQCDASPCIDGDVIYVGECFSVVENEPISDQRAIALNKTSGEEIWHYVEPNGCGWVGSPVVHDDCVYYTTGSHDYATHISTGSGVYALNKTNGERIWQTDIGFFVCSVAYHEGAVFVSGSDYTNPQGQFALNATTGEIIWHVNWGPSWDSSPVIYEGKIIQVAIDRALYPTQRSTFILDETNGRYIRKFSGKGTPSTPLVHGGKLFIPDDDWRMWAFDIETGEEIWRTVELHDGTLSNHSYCSPAASGGAIYYQSLNGTFYVMDEADGSILWSYDLGGLGVGSPSIGDGCVFITNDSGLYAFRIGPGSGNWPMFCQNPLHRSASDQGIEYLRWPLTQPQDLLASNTWVTAEFVWRNKTVVSGAIAWRIYFFDDAGNTNATNVQIFCIFDTDLNADGKVNITDITIVAVSFGSRPGDAKWNAIADLDHDGIVNILDISLVAKDYGRTT